MAGKVDIDRERCKSCGLCVTVCPSKSLVISKTSNALGHFPVEATGGPCTGCGLCALICPDVALEVQREIKESKQNV